MLEGRCGIISLSCWDRWVEKEKHTPVCVCGGVKGQHRSERGGGGTALVDTTDVAGPDGSSPGEHHHLQILTPSLFQVARVLRAFIVKL